MYSIYVFNYVLVLQKRAVVASREYGSITRVWMFIFPFFVIFEPEYLQQILGSMKHTNKSFFYKLLHNFLGNGLITNSGEKWSTHRKYIQPTFHMSILEKFIETFADSAQCLHHKIANAKSDVLNITNFVNDCVLDVLNGDFHFSFFLFFISKFI
jgi:cytochrome P450 family 4